MEYNIAIDRACGGVDHFCCVVDEEFSAYISRFFVAFGKHP